MKFDVYSDELAEALYWFMQGKYAEYCKYLSGTARDVSLAEYVDKFHKSEFKAYVENMGFSFSE